jgi:hypothetical protein
MADDDEFRILNERRPSARSLGHATDRSGFLAVDIVRDIWEGLQLPSSALTSLELPGDDGKPTVPSSYKIGLLAQGTIGLTGLLAALFHSLRTQDQTVATVSVSAKHATIEFQSEKLYVLAGKPTPSTWGPIGGLHKTSDGHVRIHDSFPNHRDGTLELLDLPVGASRADVTKSTADWAAVDLESVGLDCRLAIYAVRSYAQWDKLPQSRAIDDFPIGLSQVAPGTPGIPRHISGVGDRCLRGLRVVELSRVIAAPLAGKTLAAHGADVIWVTSPGLPDLPAIDREFGRGKRTVQLDLHNTSDRQKLRELIKTADVFIQGFRPGSIAAKGFSPDEVASLCPQGIVYGNMSAFGPKGPWAGRRGFDSLVQTGSRRGRRRARHWTTPGATCSRRAPWRRCIAGRPKAARTSLMSRWPAP